jgi:hypothetical protein
MAEGQHQMGMVRGYFWSILFMMSMPFVIFGGLATYFYLQVKRAGITRSASVQEASNVEHVSVG